MEFNIRKVVIIVLVVSAAAACSNPGPPGANRQQDLEDPFPPHGTSGTLLLFDERRETWASSDFERASTGYLPASTFKIPHALIALETGVIKADDVLEWDGKERSIPAWNRDHTLQTAIQGSVVWFFQEMARRIGEERMAAWVEALDYGNQDIGGEIDTFWLSGALRISAVEQIDFFRRFAGGALPVSKTAVASVKKAMLLEKTDSWQLYGKTGWALRKDPGIGWLAGFVECQDGRIFYALNMDIRKTQQLDLRKQIVLDVVPERCLQRHQ